MNDQLVDQQIIVDTTGFTPPVPSGVAIWNDLLMFTADNDDLHYYQFDGSTWNLLNIVVAPRIFIRNTCELYGNVSTVSYIPGLLDQERIGIFFFDGSVWSNGANLDFVALAPTTYFSGLFKSIPEDNSYALFVTDTNSHSSDSVGRLGGVTPASISVEPQLVPVRFGVPTISQFIIKSFGTYVLFYDQLFTGQIFSPYKDFSTELPSNIEILFNGVWQKEAVFATGAHDDAQHYANFC